MSRPLTVILLYFLLSNLLSAQVSVGLNYAQLQSDNWTYAIGQNGSTELSDPLNDGYLFSLGYEFQISARPITTIGGSIQLGGFENLSKHPVSRMDMEFDLNMIYYQLSATSYVFDRLNDRQAAFSAKKGSFFRRGFHLFLRAGIVNIQNSVSQPAIQSEQTHSENRFSIGGGLGQDLPLNEYLSLTIQMGVNYTVRTTYINYGVNIDGMNPDRIMLIENDMDLLSATVLHAGISLRWHLDAIDCIMMPVDALHNISE